MVPSLLMGILRVAALLVAALLVSALWWARITSLVSSL